MNNPLKYIVLTGVFGLTLLPFIISDNLFFPFITAKGFMFKIVVELIFAAWLILCLKDSSYRPKRTPLIISFAIFLVVIAGANLLGENPSKSFWSNYERMEGWVLLLHLFAYMLVAATALKTEKLWRYFWNTSLGASTIVCFMGVLQLFGVMNINQGDVRLDANIGNATYLAVYLLFHIFIALFFYVREREKSGFSWLYILVAFFNGIILYHTATRGALLGLLVGLLVTSILIAIFEKERKLLRKSAVGILATILVLTGGFLLLKDTAFLKESPVLSRFNPQALQGTASTRFLVWNIAIEGFKERPLLGWGQENFNYVFNKYYDPQMHNEEQWFDRSHSVIFDWLIAGGILGLIAYLLLLGSAVYAVWKGNFSVTEKAILVGLIGAYVFQNLFVFDNILSYFLFVSLLAFLSSNRDTAPEIVNLEGVSAKDSSPLGIALVIILLLYGGYVVNFKAYAANRTLIKGFFAVQIKDLRAAEVHFEKALAYNSLGTAEIREQVAQTAMSLAQSPDVPVKTKETFFALGKKALEDQISETPDDVRHYVIFSSFLNAFGMIDESIVVLEKASLLSPKKQIILFALGTDYYYKKEYEKMYELFKKAYDLAPEFVEVKLIYAFSAIISKRDSVAEDVLAEVPKTTVAMDNRLITAYQERGSFTKILELLKLRVSYEPTNYRHHYSLAATYVAMGERIKAITELEEAIKLNPAITAEAEGYIKEIKAGRNP